jgi:hypothetical protein
MGYRNYAEEANYEYERQRRIAVQTPARAPQPAQAASLTVEQLQCSHPDLYAAVFAAGHEEGATGERELSLARAARIQRERRQGIAASSLTTRIVAHGGGPVWAGEEALAGSTPEAVKAATALVSKLVF